MNCPHCNHPLTPAEIKSLRGQMNRAKAGHVDPEKAKARAKKAAAARWARKRKAES